ncbi:dihydrolipoyl dehydrogenase family protein [Halomicrococcus gelatinilyticus]|uniref:dihydrolipoyl dehydrogenase family protein n=1 Tax=Halomicrococcus gelatinilyticus TaxID=1702103 RepID=UPI002E126DF0
MTEFDVVVVGGGTGNNVAAAAADAGLETALIEKGPLGGTCLNRGCNPSKMLVQRANVLNGVRDAGRFGVDATVEGVDYAGMVDEISSTLSSAAENMEADYRDREHLTLYKEETRFVDERTLAVDGEEITGERVVVAAGSRPSVPPIDGIDEVEYLTSDEALYLDEPPDSLVVLGGGYISVELGYVFWSMGTDVAILERNDTLVHREDGDVAETITDVARERHDVYTGYSATAVEDDEEGVTLHAESQAGDVALTADELLVATGRRPNTDLLALDAVGIELDERGFVDTNEYLETTAENVWAQGDIAGNSQLKHAGDYETRHTVASVVHGERRSIDLSVMPHVIFTEPQVAGVGATEEELAAEGREYVVGTARYEDTAMGRAKKLDTGFAKAIATLDGEILGCHVVGESASTLVHEAVIAMQSAPGTVSDVAESIHAHPTLNKVVEAAFRDVPR